MVTRQFVFQRHACLAAFSVLLFAFPTWAQVSPPANPAPADSAPANTAPVAQADSFAVDQGSMENTFNPLNNDSDSDGDAITITAALANSGGEVTIAEDGLSLSYQPAASFSGTETITYTVSDTQNNSDEAEISVTVIKLESKDDGGGSSFGFFMLFSLLLLMTTIRLSKADNNF